MLGEGSDKLSSSTVTELDTKLTEGKTNDTSSLLSNVQSILSKMPGETGDAGNKAQELQDVKNNALNIDPDAVVPEQAQQVFLQALRIRDDIMRCVCLPFDIVSELDSVIQDRRELHGVRADGAAVP